MTQQATSLQQARGGAVQQRQKQDFPAMLKAFEGEIARALPSHLSADRMSRIALTEFRKNPKLAECDPRSVFAAVIMSSQLGLEIGMQGQSYLVPYGRECQFIPGWKGLVDLVSRAGRANVWTGAVYEGDEFDYGMGDSQWIKHKAGDDHGTGKLLYCYAVGRIRGSEQPIIEVWSVKRLEKHRDKYNKVGKRHYSFEHFEAYGRKIALLRVMDFMPKSAEMQKAIDFSHNVENAANAGVGSTFGVDDAINGTWSQVPENQPEIPQQVEQQGQTVDVNSYAQNVRAQGQQQTGQVDDDFVQAFNQAEANGIGSASME